jgi:hypothetical protein
MNCKANKILTAQPNPATALIDGQHADNADFKDNRRYKE